jgi:trk system potassium uptake protein TrkA
MRVVIVGIGEIGFELARSLGDKKGNELVLVDSDEERCRELSEQLDALVLNGDGSNPEILEKAQVREADALVATTGVDSINAVVAMLGKMMGVEKVLVKLSSASLQSACRHIGVTGIVTPTVSAAAQIISALYGFARVNFASVASGGLQLEVVEVEKKAAGRLGELEIPKRAHVVAVQRAERMMLPGAGTQLSPGDEILFLVEDPRVLETLHRELQAEEEDGEEAAPGKGGEDGTKKAE